MSGKRSGQSSYRLGKQTSSCSTKTKLQFPVSHEEPLLQESHPAQNLSFSRQVCLSAILKYVATNILELVGNKAHHNCRVQTAMDNNMQTSLLFEDDTTSQVSEMF
ncbi:histone H2A-like [Eumetopias jubatus]|uniref:Histone H2A n=1 Tax=Callorhinus ursinus TaxID=34884 RepID=A0A3Q7NFF3_CALUR|nr:histone H2A-like [Callorhinus ursinus]XP_027979639.1 histone H2A-like [Eumetopias jubatus]